MTIDSSMYFGYDPVTGHLRDITKQLVDFSERNDRFFELLNLLITSQEKTATH